MRYKTVNKGTSHILTPVGGNLTSRTDNIKGLAETFTYDDLDRLLSWQSTGNPLYQTHYATNGNITYKSDITTSSLDYDPAKIHALTKVNDPLADFNSTNQEITYTGFNKVESITQDDPDNNVTHQLTFTYGPDHYRRKTVMTDIDMTTGDETVVYTRYYDGNYEKEINSNGTKEFYYIGGPMGIIAVYIVTNGSGQLYYTLTDHLGSIVALMDENGNIVEETNYDPWGRLRNPNNCTYSNSQPLSLVFRGFTGHSLSRYEVIGKMLPEFGLINMNGRLYDPALGRFLSPDNYVQDPYNPQNYNRYSYCMNNPLIYTDPSGEFYGWDDLIVGGISFIAGYIYNGVSTGDWGASSILNGAIWAVGALLTYNTGGLCYSPYAALEYGTSLAATTAFASVMPSLSYPMGNLSVSFSPAFVMNGINLGIGMNVSANYRTDLGNDYYANIGFSFTGMGGSFGSETRTGYGVEVGNEDFGLGLYSTKYNASNGTSQRVGGIGFHSGEFSARYENDGFPFSDTLGDGSDQYRTAAVRLNWSEYSLGFNLYTGDPETVKGVKIGDGRMKEGYYYGGNVDSYRLGALYFGYKDYRLGTNSEHIRDAIQNQAIHNFIRVQPGFTMIDKTWNAYYSFQNNNPYSLW